MRKDVAYEGHLITPRCAELFLQGKTGPKKGDLSESEKFATVKCLSNNTIENIRV